MVFLKACVGAYMCKASYVPGQGCELIDWNILQ